ncbi:MAG: hypothetical protein QX203_07640, partial [Methylococcaceae bacterium]
ESVKVFVLEQKQKHSPRRHEGHEVFNTLNQIIIFPSCSSCLRGEEFFKLILIILSHSLRRGNDSCWDLLLRVPKLQKHHEENK